MRPLDTPTLRALEDALVARRRQLLLDLAENQHGKQRAEALIDDYEQSAADWDLAPILRDLVHAENERDRTELAAIQDALLRMREGQYGVCVACGEPIALARLQAQPEGARCVRCQAQLERRSGHTAASL